MGSGRWNHTIEFILAGKSFQISVTCFRNLSGHDVRKCGLGWHQKCVVPPLSRRPASEWQCPVCDHVELVTSLSNTLAELDVLIDKVEEKRLAEMEVNHSTEVEEEEEEERDNIVKEKESEAPSRDLIKNLPNYYESSDEEDSQPACACGGAPGSGSCAWCKKLRGCTCEGQGTCRLCEREAESEDSEDEIEILEDTSEKKTELSTTELFLLTGKVSRRPSQEEHQQVQPARGRGRGRGRGRCGSSVSNISAHPRMSVTSPALVSPAAQQSPVIIRPVVRQPRLVKHAGAGRPRMAAHQTLPTQPRTLLRGQVRMHQSTHRGLIRGTRPRQPLSRPTFQQMRPIQSGPPRFRPSSVHFGELRQRGQQAFVPVRTPPVARSSQGSQIRPRLQRPRPNVVVQLRQQPPQPSLYQQYTVQAQAGGRDRQQGVASAGQYYQQVCQEADIINISDEDDEDDVLTNYNLPPGIQIERQRVVSHDAQEVMSSYNLPAGIKIQRL